MATRRLQLSADGGIGRFSKRSSQVLAPGPPITLRVPQQLDFVVATSSLGQTLRCAWLGLVRASSNAQDLRQEPVLKDNDALDPSLNISGKRWKGRDRSSNSTAAVVAARFPVVT